MASVLVRAEPREQAVARELRLDQRGQAGRAIVLRAKPWNAALASAGRISTKAETTQSNNATFVGRRFGATPVNTCTLWNRYLFPSGPLKNFAIAGGLQHNDATHLSQDPQIQVTLPAFTVYNAMLSYRLKAGERDYRADKRYREGADGYFAPARTFYLSVGTRL